MWPQQRPSLWQRVQQMTREANYPPQNEGRVIRDLCDVTTRYPSLMPRLDKYTSEDGVTQQLVSLSGTVPITYRGATYNIPIHMWIMSYHPSGPPIIYVKPTANMDVKERHDHVDRNGRVYLPYLANWSTQQSNIVGSIAEMTDVFSRQPPVYAKGSGRGRVRSSQLSERQRLIELLSSRAKKRFREMSEEGTNDIAKLVERREKAADGSRLPPEKQALLDQRNEKQKILAELTAERDSLESYIEANDVRKGDIDVDTMIHPRDLHSEQVLECLSKDAAYLDALDQLMEASDGDKIDVTMFTKETKRIAREQFYARALLRKVKLQQAHQKQMQEQHAHRRRPA